MTETNTAARQRPVRDPECTAGPVLIVGQAVVDEIWHLTHPLQIDGHTAADTIRRNAGGLLAHAARHAEQLGIPYRIAGWSGNQAAALLTRELADPTPILNATAAGHLTCSTTDTQAVILEDGTGQRTIASRRSPDTTAPTAAAADVLGDASVILIDGHCLTGPLGEWITELATAARTAGVPILVEAASEPIEFPTDVVSGHDNELATALAGPPTTCTLRHEGCDSVELDHHGTLHTWTALPKLDTTGATGLGDRFILRVAAALRAGRNTPAAVTWALTDAPHRP